MRERRTHRRQRGARTPRAPLRVGGMRAEELEEARRQREAELATEAEICREVRERIVDLNDPNILDSMVKR